MANVQPVGPVNFACCPLLPSFDRTATRSVPAMLAAGSVTLRVPVVAVAYVRIWMLTIAAPAVAGATRAPTTTANATMYLAALIRASPALPRHETASGHEDDARQREKGEGGDHERKHDEQ